ncbi:MAG: hypothetical protein LBR33_07955 [Propionibacteriaceae bacterium]|jgi:hypothetical protein|nr:hypothetical protein [Propionibacteriaceae bacterium]
MFESLKQVLETSASTAEKYRLTLELHHQTEAAKASLLAQLISQHTHPEPSPNTPNRRRTINFDGHHVDEDLLPEIAALERTSTGAAEFLIRDTIRLHHRHPLAWAKVTAAEAPLWQARQAATAALEADLDVTECHQFDARIAPLLGQITGPRFRRALRAAIMAVNPAKARRRAYDPEGRFVRRYPTDDPTAAFVKARLDTADAIYLCATIDKIAHQLYFEDPHLDMDTCRAKALGLLSNPAAVVARFGIWTNRHLDQPPATPDDTAAFRRHCHEIARLWRPEAKLYIHAHWGNLDEDDALATIDDFGPCFMDQIKDLVGHAHVKVTPVIHVGYRDIAVDAYDIPDRIREHILIRDRYEAFPYSSKPATGCDLDHIQPYHPGRPGQTRLSNLAPLSRRVHRAKTHAGWTYTQPEPGVFHWTSPAGHHYKVDQLGTTPLPSGTDPP